MEGESQIVTLVAKIKEAKRLYYTVGDSGVLDSVYDSWEEELRQLDPNNAVFTMVGSDFIKEGEKVHLSERMFSTDKSLSMEELKSYWNRTAGAQDYILSNKVDGLALNLVYTDGQLTLATTRGNGMIGRNRTQRVKNISAIPNELPEAFSGKIRGEIYLTYENFEKFNAILAEEGLDLQANERNSAAGLINSDNLSREGDKLALLQFRAYGVYDNEDTLDDWGSYTFYSQQLGKAEKLGFETVDHIHITGEDMVDYDSLMESLTKYDFPNDGVVIRVDDQDFARKLGQGKNYLNAVTALKFEPEVVLVTVKEITWSTGSREIKPLVNFDPVQLGGAEVTKAAGHSVNNLINLEAYPGNQVALVRSGEVIPRLYHKSYVG